MWSPRQIRAVRTGWVTLCFLPTLLLVLMWVRSYWRTDLARAHVSTKPIEIISTPGRVKITRSEGVAGQFEFLKTLANDEPMAHSVQSHVEYFANRWGLG